MVKLPINPGGGGKWDCTEDAKEREAGRVPGAREKSQDTGGETQGRRMGSRNFSSLQKKMGSAFL